eukprot:TRINITY_DN1681_c0_g1_i4.p1 TRINITY_DN1681_c0_g1~~TRINITY_DN1681_c0_g1_i4.p1  ORF type:complete len:335 (-),score=95.58 TRINITY_DN1681_c0_g1_i4:57-1061(-)
MCIRDRYKHVKTDVLITGMCVVPVILSIGFVYWFRHERSESNLGDSSVAVRVAGTLLAFLTTFRSGQSYSRWFEGRAAFGRVHAGCRALALYVNGAVTKMADEGDRENARNLSSSTRLLLLGLIRSVILHLRADPCNDSLKEFMHVHEDWSEQEVYHSKEAKGYRLVQRTDAARPMILFKLLIARLSRISTLHGGSDYRMVLTEYSDMVAAFNSADKLCNTPSPNLFMYLLTFVYLFFNWWLMPILMSEVAHENYYIAPVITFFVCYFFGLLIVIALDMDNPFDGGLIDLPLEKYEAGLRRDMDMVLNPEDLEEAPPEQLTDNPVVSEKEDAQK